MKKLGFIALLLLAVFVTSCGGGETETKVDKSQIYGKWRTADSTYFEVYYSDGTGKEWDLKDDVQEAEASKFTWEYDEATDSKFLKYFTMENGAIVPQYCDILELNSTNFKYNNEGFRATYNLVRAE
ncbi:MAG: hypothetical protein IKY27_05935 [Bacteroidales bacterium]|nr:hypothetical protein [Bacteroidales bacterium]MBR5781505.1 hypothetical protein [Bacteroidales bacterium]